ncbi:MAG: hypothetical protein WBB24_12700 [Maribacter sp.]
MKKLIVFVFLGLIVSTESVLAQADCILGVGVTEDSIISDIFQLNTDQREQLVNFSAELKYRNGVLNNELDNLQKRHPQSTVTELTQLAEKYKAVMDSMQLVQSMVDKRMLGLFNSNQYELYRSLCRDASRSPYFVEPKVYPDSLNTQNR